MTALNKQALREAAERAASDSWGYDRDEFNDAITPEVALALLDELEAAEKRIAEVRGYNVDLAEESRQCQQRVAELEALVGMEVEPVFKINHDSSLIKHVKKVVRETSSPQPLTTSERAELIPVYAATPDPVSVPDERAAFETFMEKRFKDCVDRRLVKNGDGEYFAWDMQVAWIVWQGRAAMLQSAEPVSQPYTLKANSFTDEELEGMAHGDNPQANAYRELLAFRLNSPVTPDGWQLVPKEPTEAMNKAGWAAINEHDEINPTYRAMLAAAPQHEVNK